MKITTIIGARPQFIKATAISRAIAERNEKSGDMTQFSPVSCPPAGYPVIAYEKLS